MKRAHFIPGAVVLLLLIVISALGAPAWAGETLTGDNIVVQRDSTIEDNVYAAGNTVTIDGRVTGNLVVAASQVTINGTVDGNVYVGAQSLVVNGSVGDVAAGTQTLQLGPNAVVNGSVMNFGYSFESLQGSSIKSDLVFFGAQALVGGEVVKDIKGGMNGFQLRGKVGRDVDVSVGDAATDAGRFAPSSVAIPNVAAGLRLDEGSSIGRNLNYESPRSGDIGSVSKVAGQINWRQIESSATTGGGVAPQFSILNLVQRFVTLLLVGLLLIWLFPKWMNRLGDAVQAQPLSILGRGVLAFLLFLLVVIMLPIAAILLALLFGLVTLDSLAWTFGIVGLLSEIGIIAAFIVFVSYIAQAIISLVIGKWLLKRFQPSMSEGNVIPFVVGLVIYVLVTAIPVVGGLIGLVAVLLALGALWRWVRSRRTPTDAAPITSPLAAAS